MSRLSCLACASIICVTAAHAEAAVILATGCSANAVQTAIDSAHSGDTVALPTPCSATWNAIVNIPSTKGIVLDGTGVTIERGSVGIQDPILSIVLNAAVATRVTGFTFSFGVSQPDTPNGFFIAVKTDGFDGFPTYRLDHLTVIADGSLGTAISVSASPGLIDHCTFTWTATNGGEMIHNLGYLPGNPQGWSVDITPGGPDAVYIEDNVFTNRISGNPAYYWGGSAAQSYYGARTVFRHNVCNNCQMDQHGTAGAVGARWWEIYENTFNTTDVNGAQSDYIVLRGGSGVVFNNHTAGFANKGSGAIHMYEEDPGYPALYQVGRGKDQTLDPIYFWGNGPAMPASSDDSSQIAVNRDYYFAVKPGYTPYVYPHPLANASAPAPPINVRILN